MKRLALALFAILLAVSARAPAPGLTRDASGFTVRASRITTPMTIDGRLDPVVNAAQTDVTVLRVQDASSPSSLSTNLRFRWKYHPGSEWFVVYTEGLDTLPLSGAGTSERRRGRQDQSVDQVLGSDVEGDAAASIRRSAGASASAARAMAASMAG